MTGEARTDIPASAVPRYPVLRLTWRSDGTVTLDDEVVVPAGKPELDARLAALEVCAAHARERGGDPPVVRVVALNEDSGETWPMGVTGDGDVITLQEMSTDKAGAAAGRRLSRRTLIGVGAVVGAGVVGGGSWALVSQLRAQPARRPTAAPRPPGAGNLVPVAVPAGFANTALWTAPVAGKAPVGQLRDGRILTVDPESSALRAHDPATGRVTWTGTGHSSADDISEVVIDSRPFLMTLHSRTAMQLWPLDQGTPIAGSTLSLPDRDAQLFTGGAAPAVALPTQTGLIFTGSKTATFDIPVGYSLIGASADGRAVLLGGDGWALLRPGDKTVRPTRLLSPSKKHRNAGGFMLGEDRLLVLQDGPDPRWALFATDSSNALVSAPTSGRKLPSPDKLLTNADRSVWAVDDVVVAQDTLTAIDGFTATTVTSQGVYGTKDSKPVLVHPGDKEPTMLPTDVTMPSVVTDSLAVIVATKLDTPTAYVVGRSS